MTLLLPPAAICFAVATASPSPLGSGRESRSDKPVLAGRSAIADRPGAAVEAQTPPDKLPEAPGKAVVVRVCTSCHDSALITDAPRTVAGWDDMMYVMKDFGAMATEEEWKTVFDYLVTHLALLEVNKATAAHLQLVFGVSDSVASDVVAYREKQGGFKAIDDLKTAPGLDAAKVDSLKERLLFR